MYILLASAAALVLTKRIKRIIFDIKIKNNDKFKAMFYF